LKKELIYDRMKRFIKIFMKKLILCLCTLILLSITTNDVYARPEGIKKTFTITGYYSPLPNQNFYITGSYESEKRLNGQGIAGADGTAVYPGMIAAPQTYAFGTQICIPNLGCGKVHDRGGAIVEQGQTNLAKHDRLDVWMGYGEEGLLRALAWGVEHVECEMYPESANIDIRMNFEVPPQLNDIIDLPNRPIFSQNLSIGNTGERVKSLQLALNRLGFYEGFQDGVFNTEVKDAVFQFQRKYFILNKESDVGAGNFGPQTRAKLTEILYKNNVQEKIKEAWDNFHFDEEMSTGEQNHDVFKLQQMLVQREFMTVNPTGYFGPKTKAALIEFQIAEGIIRSQYAAGAGNVGPKTKERLNEILIEEKEQYENEQLLQLAYKKERNQFAIIAGKPLEFKQTVAQQ
jgi:peptidoglycan hydrolase-like protein with peptidoglycan-binding domain/3D (Asp-Asp-Asp) domain-containing protein